MPYHIWVKSVGLLPFYCLIRFSKAGLRDNLTHRFSRFFGKFPKEGGISNRKVSVEVFYVWNGLLDHDFLGTLLKFYIFFVNNSGTQENWSFLTCHIFPNRRVALSSIYISLGQLWSTISRLMVGHLSSVPYRAAQFVTSADTTLEKPNKQQQQKFSKGWRWNVIVHQNILGPEFK